jgi:hypothetical protein
LYVQISYLKEEFALSKNNTLKWQKLAPIAAGCFSRTPSYTYMFGTFQIGEVAPAQKKARKQRDKEEKESKKRPENVSTVSEEMKRSTNRKSVKT